jgi:hypothetical protein
MVFRKERPVTLRLNWDHYVPFAFLAKNPSDNWRAACHVCNGLKSAVMYGEIEIEEVRRRIAALRWSKGYRLTPTGGGY